MGMYDTYESLTDAEKDFVKEHPVVAWEFREAADTAFAEAKKRYPSSLHNGKGDAFRHAYWNALMVRAEDEKLAKEFADAHETKAGQPLSEQTMDLHNNAVGRRIGLLYRRSSDAEIAKAVERALASGQLFILK